MKKILVWAFASWLLMSCNSSKSSDDSSTKDSSSAVTVASVDTKKEMATEIADDRYVEFGKRAIESLVSGNLDPWFNDFADDAKYFWNRGDSLVGKAAIVAYWKKRRTEVIDSISYLNPIFLAVKVNKPQQAVHSSGIWLLSWYQVDAKYKTGKHMRQWIHNDVHFNQNDKIDQVIQYIDNSVVMAAMKK